MRWIYASAVVAMGMGWSASSQELRISSFADGKLEWETPAPDRRYVVEWSPDMIVWYDDWTRLNDIASTGSVVSVDVPMSFRVRQVSQDNSFLQTDGANSTPDSAVADSRDDRTDHANHHGWDVGPTGHAHRVRFDESGGIVSAGDRFDLGTGTRSFSAWVKAGPGNDGQAIVAKATWPGHWRGYLVAIHWALSAPPGVVAVVLGDGNDDARVFGSTRIDDNEWHHVVAIVHRSRLPEIYIDGTRDAVVEDPRMTPWTAFSDLDLDTDAPFTIAGTADLVHPKQLGGSVVHARVFPHGLSPERIQSLYEMGPGD